MTATDRAAVRRIVWLAFLLASAALWWPVRAAAARVKEVASVAGVRSNQLIGYGLVVGLDGSGDQTTAAPVHHAEPDHDAAAAGRDHAAGHAACSCRTSPR